MKNILVPLDFSEESTNALNIANQLAKKGKGEIIVSHSIEIPDYFDPSFESNDSYKSDLLKTVRLKIDQILKDEDLTISEASIKIKFGHPLDHILELIKSDQVDLIVMGSKGSRSWKDQMIGSNTEKVARYTTCPVLIVKDRVDISEIKDIVFATDLHNTPVFITSSLRNLQELIGAKLHLLKVITPGNWATNLEVRKEMDTFAEFHSLTDYSMRIYNDVDVEDGIVHYSNEINAGMVALTSHTKIHIPSLISDNRITERVVENSNHLIWTCGLGDRLYR